MRPKLWAYAPTQLWAQPELERGPPSLALTLRRWVRNQEREFVAAGLRVHGAAAVFAALDAARKQSVMTAG